MKIIIFVSVWYSRESSVTRKPPLSHRCQSSHPLHFSLSLSLRSALKAKTSKTLKMVFLFFWWEILVWVVLAWVDLDQWVNNHFGPPLLNLSPNKNDEVRAKMGNFEKISPFFRQGVFPNLAKTIRHCSCWLRISYGFFCNTLILNNYWGDI